MTMRGATLRSAFATALLAVALLGFASTRSIVMQAVAAATPAQGPCADMAGMGKPAGGAAPAGKAHKACEYCAAAAHAPLCAAAAAIPDSTSVEWMAYAALESPGRRGPADVTPRARGPPQTSRTT
jgi:hypothetical protein